MRKQGFTIIELLVAMAIIATLLSLAAPKYFNNLERTKEAVLRENLYLMRDAIDKYYTDKGTYPKELNDLVKERYLRAIPIDPFTESAAGWKSVAPEDTTLGGVYDVRSTAPNSKSGTKYSEW
ncbi:type II secretion system protein [Chitinimonas sp. JJ19]|uniref:type II secretion system protein n=1 Tax=Chitinimonas sp. JJ19 TaxID=3109352 RepID=UPI003002FE3F